jgi:class 3 adenylate cyclase/tetratricopeptide (TPR) repeat protein
MMIPVPAPEGPTADELLQPYVPRLLVDWLRTAPDARVREVEGSLAFVDISGFTALTERLARRGKIGAEEMSDTLSAVFSGLLALAYGDGAGLVKWGGDAVLLLFEGDGHAPRAARAASRMRTALRVLGRVETGAGHVQLRMSVGIHSGTFQFFLVGDPARHRELLVAGPAATVTAEVEGVAVAGEVGLSPAAAALLPARDVKPGREGTYLLAREPTVEATAAPPPPVTRGLNLASALSAPMRDHLLAGGADPEHRQVAVGFVRFSGTDGLARAEGVERLAAALDEAVRNVQEACDHHGVTFFETDIDKDGGKIMLVAGAPTTAGQNEERMLLAARRILGRPGTLPIRIGVNAGPVFSGDFGPPFRRTYSIKGDAVNLAARVMGKAGQGQLLATAGSLERSRTRFATEWLTPFLVKGKRQPVEAAIVGEPVRSPEASRDELPLVGREAELATMRAALDDARAGRGRVVELVGEPGIGKSRLVEELARGADDATVVTATCDEYESATPYYPFRALLHEVAGVPSGTPPGEVLARLTARVRGPAPDLLQWLPLLGIPLDLDLGETAASRGLDERFRKAKVEEVCGRFLELCLQAPVVLVVEDTHLVDDASADLLAHLCRMAEGLRWLVLLTRRDVADGFVPTTDGVVTVRPAPLDTLGATALLEQVLQDAPLPPHQVAAIAEKAGGNPLFLGGLLAAARAGRVGDGSLPDSVEGLVSSQIDRLPAGERALLRAAAVLGVTFAEDELRLVLDSDQLPRGRESLARLAEFIEPAGFGRFRFRHALMRDAAYEGLPYRRRREMHGRVGEALEHAGGAPEERAELLSLHYFHAGRNDKAWYFARVAGARSRQKYANVEAVELWQRAVESARRVPGVEPGELAAVHEQMADAQMLIGEADDARRSFRAARRLTPDGPVAVARLLLKEAQVDLHQGRPLACLQTLTRGLRVLEPVEPSTPALVAQRARLESFYAWARYRQGRYRDAMTWGGRAASDAETADDRPALAEVYAVLQAVSTWSSYAHDRPYGDLALRLYEELGDGRQQANMLNNLAGSAFFAGRWTEALDMYARASEGYAAAGDALGVALATYNQAEITSRQGRYEEAEASLRQARTAAAALGDLDLVAVAVRELGRLMALTGRAGEAAELLGEAREMFARTGEAYEVLATDVELALATLTSGDAAAALAAIDDARERAQSLDAVALAPTVSRLRGDVLLALGRTEQARDELVEAVAAAEADGAYETGFLLLALAEARDRLGEPGADDARTQGERLLDELGVRAAARTPLVAVG